MPGPNTYNFAFARNKSRLSLQTPPPSSKRAAYHIDLPENNDMPNPRQAESHENALPFKFDNGCVLTYTIYSFHKTSLYYSVRQSALARIVI